MMMIFRSVRVVKFFVCSVCQEERIKFLVSPAEIRKICLLFGRFVAIPGVRYVAQVPSVTRVKKFRP